MDKSNKKSKIASHAGASGVANKKTSKVPLYPNCSEMVFRLRGDFEDIRKQMYNVVEWTRKEYTGEAGDSPKQKLSPKIKARIEELKSSIKQAKSLEDFEKLVIEFTCNYETFFKKEEDDLLVATCNNYNWDDVDKCEEDDREYSYYDVAGYTNYDYIEDMAGYKVLRLRYDDEDHKKFPKYVVLPLDFSLSDDEGEGTELKKGHYTKLVVRQGATFAVIKDKLIQIPEVKDEALINKVKILLNLQD